MKDNRAPEKGRKAKAPSPKVFSGPASKKSLPPPAATPRRSPAELAAALEAGIGDAAPVIVAKMVEQAKEGSYQHAKFLFELARLFPLPPPPSAEDEHPALALLRELDILPRDPEEDAASPGTLERRS